MISIISMTDFFIVDFYFTTSAFLTQSTKVLMVFEHKVHEDLYLLEAQRRFTLIRSISISRRFLGFCRLLNPLDL